MPVSTLKGDKSLIDKVLEQSIYNKMLDMSVLRGGGGLSSHYLVACRLSNYYFYGPRKGF